MARVCIDFDEIEDDALPRVCMLCGDPANTVVSRKFSWCPNWVPVLILAGLLPYVIVASILTRYRRMDVPLCERHANHWRWRFWFTLLSFLAFLLLGALAIGGMAYLDNQRQNNNDLFGLLIISIPVVFIVWLITIAVVQNSALRASEIKDDEICFGKVAPVFAEALEEIRRRADEHGEQGKPWALPDDGIPVVHPLD